MDKKDPDKVEEFESALTSEKGEENMYHASM